MTEFWSILFSTGFLFTAIRVTTPIIFASLACLIAKKAGVRNITIEGTMLVSALVGVLASHYCGNVWVAVFIGMLAGIAIGLFLGYFHIIMDTDIWLTGIAINQIAMGGTVFAMFAITGDKGSTAALNSLTVPNIHIPIIKDIPILGEVLSGHSFFTYLAFICVFLMYYLLYKTPLGLRIRAVGEYAMAAESVGENANRIKLIALAISGMCAAFGGMFMSMSYASRFVRDMTGGRGFIGIAAESMGGGNPLGATLSAFIFGFADALANTLQSFSIPSELVLMIPYLTTIVGLVLYSVQRKRKEEESLKKKRALQQGEESL